MRVHSILRRRFLASTVAVLALGALSAGCEIIVDFNRALIEGGVDGSFSTVEASVDAGDAGFSTIDAGTDGGLGVPDAVSDVVFSDVSCGTCVKDATVDAATGG